MILMKLWPEIRDAHEGFWRLWVWYCLSFGHDFSIRREDWCVKWTKSRSGE